MGLNRIVKPSELQRGVGWPLIEFSTGLGMDVALFMVAICALSMP